MLLLRINWKGRIRIIHETVVRINNKAITKLSSKSGTYKWRNLENQRRHWENKKSSW